MLGVVGMGVQEPVLPVRSRPEILVDLWYPEGTSFAANEEVTKAEARAPRGVAHVTTWVGSGAERFALPLDRPDLPQSNVSLMIVMPGSGVAQWCAVELPNCWLASSPRRARVAAAANGPPVPYPVQFPRRRTGSGAGARQLADRSGVHACAPTMPNLIGVNDN